jgi:hypothetical protein
MYKDSQKSQVKNCKDIAVIASKVSLKKGFEVIAHLNPILNAFESYLF